MADTLGARPTGLDDETRWPLVKVFDVAAAVLVGTVAVRAIGSILSALEVPSVHLNLGAASGSGLSVHAADFGIPTYLRIQYGTVWADLTSGLLLLVALGLVAVPRMVWDVPSEEQWAAAAPRLVVGVLVVSALATVAAVVGIANQIWHTSELDQSTEALNVSKGVAAVALTTLSCTLSWFAIPFTRASSTDQQLVRGSADQPGA